MYYLRLRNGVYQKPVCPEMASDTPVLTSLHISFAKIFCQNKIKKNRKFVLQFAFENGDIR